MSEGVCLLKALSPKYAVGVLDMVRVPVIFFFNTRIGYVLDDHILLSAQARAHQSALTSLFNMPVVVEEQNG